ncbi:hypothetical protein DFH08DRAFT_891724 [Mycena albidolilacea]|uniref:Uncharacterized protein n=1 Tax=Mycena albidolilacea TaxID=1033008 RepID=A0AAD6ZDL7_9AGAR|nr:hypothetical protein DFH08DRAFT_891724 [Mycena albidolilacea]
MLRAGSTPSAGDGRGRGEGTGTGARADSVSSAGGTRSSGGLAKGRREVVGSARKSRNANGPRSCLDSSSIAIVPSHPVPFVGSKRVFRGGRGWEDVPNTRRLASWCRCSTDIREAGVGEMHARHLWELCTHGSTVRRLRWDARPAQPELRARVHKSRNVNGQRRCALVCDLFWTWHALLGAVVCKHQV